MRASGWVAWACKKGPPRRMRNVSGLRQRGSGRLAAAGPLGRRLLGGRTLGRRRFACRGSCCHTRFLAASVLLSFMALVASSVNCLVSAPHHCMGSTTPGAGEAGSASSAGVGLGAEAGAAALGAGAAGDAVAGSGTFSVMASRNSPMETFMVLSVDSVMRCTSMAWMVAPSMRAFCSSQNCTVRNSSMRFSSSSGFSVGATHWPMLGSAEPAFLTRPCKKSNPGTSLLKFVASVMASPGGLFRRVVQNAATIVRPGSTAAGSVFTHPLRAPPGSQARP